MHTYFSYFIDAVLGQSGGQVTSSGPFQVCLQLWLSANYPEPYGMSRELFTHVQRAWSLTLHFLQDMGSLWSSKTKSINVLWELHMPSQCMLFACRIVSQVWDIILKISGRNLHASPWNASCAPWPELHLLSKQVSTVPLKQMGTHWFLVAKDLLILHINKC